MDLRDLTYFETIARTGHLGKAAELLHKSQPALSKSIQRLEEALGAQLFRQETGDSQTIRRPPLEVCPADLVSSFHRSH